MNEYDKIIIKAGIVLFTLTALMMALLIFNT